MGHKHIKDLYKRTNKREPEKQMTESDQRLGNLRRMEELYEQAELGLSNNETPDRIADNSDTIIRPELHYQISNKGTPIRLDDWLKEHEADPAITVRLFTHRKQCY